MSNPRYITENGKPTPELLSKLDAAKKAYYGNLCSFCRRYSIDVNSIGGVEKVFLVGSQATEGQWTEESDLDLGLVNSSERLRLLYGYKKRVLDPKLLQGPKDRWIDLFFASSEEDISHPKMDLTGYWAGVRRE